MAEPVGVAVIGCGGVSPGHLGAYASNPTARLVATVDVRPELAEAAAKRYGAKRWYSSVEEPLADPEVQAIDPCLPHHWAGTRPSASRPRGRGQTAPHPRRGRDARKSLELVVAADESIKSGWPVRLPLVPAGAAR